MWVSGEGREGEKKGGREGRIHFALGGGRIARAGAKDIDEWMERKSVKVCWCGKNSAGKVFVNNVI